jgi:hypothetical protein
VGRRYESKRSDVRENLEEGERIKSDQSILKNEYSLLSSIEGLLSDVDTEISDTVLAVENVGHQEEGRLDNEQHENNTEKEKVVGEINQEIAKLNAGLEKMNELDKYNFGKNSLEQGKSEYKEQIEKFKALKAELLEASESGDASAINAVLENNSSAIEQLYENDVQTETTSGVSDNTLTSFTTQKEHKPLVSSRTEAINAVISDVQAGSGKTITAEQAANYYDSVQMFSGQDMSGNNDDYRRIRNAYNNPRASQEDVERMQYLDEYLKSAPKWEGQVYRGINVDKKVADNILSQESVDMLGPASWSSEFDTAERFSRGSKPVRMIFILPENKSGASITHIASFNGAESEITAPSGVKYSIQRHEKVNKDNRDFIYVYLKE